MTLKNVDYDSNPDNNPELHGLEVIDRLDTAGSYEFDTTIVWRHKESGKLYYAHDWGCSCPTPFENCTEIEEITSDTFEDFKRHVMNQQWSSERGGKADEMSEKLMFAQKIKNLL